jgi:hypothetical protein
MKRLVIALGLCIAVLVCVMGVRAARVPAPAPPSSGTTAAVPVDAAVAAERLAGAVRFKTVS